MLFAPLPSWLDLARGLFRRATDVELVAPWVRDGEIGGLLSQSAWSLALISLWRQRFVATRATRVWLPDYFCDSSLAPLRHVGATLVFYPVTSDIEPDYAGCRQLAASDPPDVFVLVHYFGRPCSVASARDFCTRHCAWLVEDAAHVLRPITGVGEDGDFVLYSPHKQLPIPDGAVLIVRSNGPASLTRSELQSLGAPGTWSGQLRNLADRMRDTGRIRVFHSAIWLGKRTLQKLGVRAPWTVEVFAERPSKADNSLHQGRPEISHLSRHLMAGLVNGLDEISRMRERVTLAWDAALEQTGEIAASELRPSYRPAEETWTPHLAVYAGHNAEVTATAFARWRNRRIPVLTWPDLPTETVENAQDHPTAWNLRHTRLFLPVHHSVSIAEIASTVYGKGAIGDALLDFSVTWNQHSRDDWELWIDRIPFSNILQTWAYADAKAVTQSWIPRRGVIRRDTGEPVAIVQALEKRYFRVLKVTRINRGPLFFSPPSDDDVIKTMKLLAQLGCAWKGRLLLIAPELDKRGANLILMSQLGFKDSAARNWRSGCLDLTRTLDELRGNLNGKRIRWKQTLDTPEHKGLTIEACSSEDAFRWMLERYKELMVPRDPATAMLAALYESFRERCRADQVLVFRALVGAEPIAGICIVIHGMVATYLIGWNGDAGRKLSANSFLFWFAIKTLKARGLSLLDLNGIDDVSTPGIAAFKLGLGPKPYERVGEYWKI